MRHWLEVGWSDARSYAAEVVEFQSCGDGADHQFVGKAVGHDLDTVHR